MRQDNVGLHDEADAQMFGRLLLSRMGRPITTHKRVAEGYTFCNAIREHDSYFGMEGRVSSIECEPLLILSIYASVDVQDLRSLALCIGGAKVWNHLSTFAILSFIHSSVLS